MGATILLFFNGGGPIASATTQPAFWIPASTETVDTYRASTESVDTYRTAIDDRTN